MKLSQRVVNMAESATIKMATMARELKSKGVDIIDLSLGEPDFDTPEHIKKAATEALAAGYTKYTPVAGLLELREAISAKFKRENNLDYKPSQIVVSNGAKQSIANLCLALLDPGDEGIIFSPYWVSYSEIIQVAEGIPVQVYAGINQDFKVHAEQLELAITPRTRFILFSSPCNPTGSVYTRSELKAIADVLSRYPDILVISDEIYEHINFTEEHVSIGSFESVKDRTITVNGFSKGFAMTGWRLGYIGAPQWVADACAKIQGQFTSGAASFSQKAAAYALTADMKPTEDMRTAFLRRRDLMIEGLSKIKGFIVNQPQGAFYIFPDVSYYFGKSYEGEVIKNSNDFCMFLLKHAHVSAVEGGAFGAPECFRISYATSDEKLLSAIDRIHNAVNMLS